MAFSLFVSLLVCVSLPAEGDTIGSHIAYLICSGFSVLVCVSSLIVDKELLYLLPIVASAFSVYTWKFPMWLISSLKMDMEKKG
jgi:hypothetical protein